MASAMLTQTWCLGADSAHILYPLTLPVGLIAMFARTLFADAGFIFIDQLRTVKAILQPLASDICPDKDKIQVYCASVASFPGLCSSFL